MNLDAGHGSCILPSEMMSTIIMWDLTTSQQDPFKTQIHTLHLTVHSWLAMFP